MQNRVYFILLAASVLLLSCQSYHRVNKVSVRKEKVTHDFRKIHESASKKETEKLSLIDSSTFELLLIEKKSSKTKFYKQYSCEKILSVKCNKEIENPPDSLKKNKNISPTNKITKDNKVKIEPIGFLSLVCFLISITAVIVGIFTSNYILLLVLVLPYLGGILGIASIIRIKKEPELFKNKFIAYFGAISNFSLILIEMLLVILTVIFYLLFYLLIWGLVYLILSGWQII